MRLPHWVEKRIEVVPVNFTGQIVIEFMSGGVTRMDVKEIVSPPKGERLERHAL